VREAWGAIDVQLQRRASLVPNLVETVRGYAAYERETMIRIVEARGALTSAGGPREAARANQDLTGVLHRMFALAEAYPELKANSASCSSTRLAGHQNRSPTPELLQRRG
jgi:LemA protein